MGKFTLLYFVTAGFYSLYWFYRCWAGIEQVTGKRYFKFGRAAFAVLFVLDLFEQLHQVDKQRGDTHFWQPARMAWIFIGAAIAQFVLTYWAEYLQLGCWARLIIFVLVLVVQFYTLYQVHLVVNRLEKDPFGRQNQRLSLRNHAWIVFGIYIWFSLFRSCLMPAPPPAPDQPAETAPPAKVL